MLSRAIKVPSKYMMLLIVDQITMTSNVKPKGRMSAYTYCVQTCREEHREKYPSQKVVFAEFSKQCADRLKTLTQDDKKRFNEMAHEDKNTL